MKTKLAATCRLPSAIWHLPSAIWHLLSAICYLLSAICVPAFAQGTAFTNQGRLNDGANPASGIYDLRFAIYDSTNNPGVVIAGPLTNSATAVSNGLFTVLLDFGAGAFTGPDRWLDIAVRSNGLPTFNPLTPRQKITPTPYAITASNLTGTVAASQLTGTISSNNIGNSSITTAMLASGAVGSNQLAAGAVTTVALADGAVTAPKVGTISNWFALTIANPFPGNGDVFGISMAVFGNDRLIIGSRFDDGFLTSSGSAYLFNTNGTLLTIFTNPTPGFADFFGNAVAAVGNDRVLIAANQNSLGANSEGTVYLFSTNGALLTTFTNPTPVSPEGFGNAVAALGSDRVIISTSFEDTGALDSGLVYLFNVNGTLVNTFTNPTPSPSDRFGNALAVVGNDRLLIGAALDNPASINDAGAAHLFNTNGTLLITFTNPTPQISEQFGISVAAMGNDRLLIGASGDNTGAAAAGAAYLYSTNGTLLTTFTNPTPAFSNRFGISVAAQGSDRVIIGAAGDDAGAILGAGAAYVFTTNGTLLLTFTNPTPTMNDAFGWLVAPVGNTRVLVAAYLDDTAATNSGVAYLFGFESFTPGLVADAVNARSITTSSLEDGAVTAAKIGGVLADDQIPGLNASKITSGQLDDFFLSANVALRAGGNDFNGDQTISGGNLGVGTNAPAAVLHVNGIARIEGNLTTATNVTVGALFALSRVTLVPANDSTITPTASYLLLNPTAAITLSVITAIANGTTPGTILILEGTDNVQTVTINNASNVSLAAASRVLGIRDTLMLMWNGADWIELSFSNN